MPRVIVYTRFNSVGNGEDELIINGIVNEEFRRQGEKYWRYRKQMESKNSKLIKEKMDALKAMVLPPVNKSFVDKAKDVYIFVMACIICFLEWAGWVVYDPKKKNEE